jgi:hypothetical protein
MRLLAVAAQDVPIGRLGVSTDQAPVIIPVNYRLVDDALLLRVGPGATTQSAAGTLVAFEVDHVDRRAGSAWSVLVRGLASLVTSPTDRQLASGAHPFVPEPGNMMLVIRPDVVTGRRFTLGTSAGPLHRGDVVVGQGAERAR